MLSHLTPSRALSAAGDLLAALSIVFGGTYLVGLFSAIGG